MSIARRTWQRDQGCPFATRGRLGVRPRGPAGRDGYEVDAMIGAPVYPLANRTCSHWPNPASRPAAGSSMPKTYSAIMHAGVQVSVVPPNRYYRRPFSITTTRRRS